MNFNAQLFDQIFIEFTNGTGQSSFNTVIKWTNGKFISLSPGSRTHYDMIMKVTKYLQSCDDSNSVEPFHCVFEFLARKSNCGLPWLKKYYRTKDYTECKSDSELFDFLTLYHQILNGSTKTEIEDLGCYQKICDQYMWQTETFTVYKEEEKFRTNLTTLHFSINDKDVSMNVKELKNIL